MRLLFFFSFVFIITVQGHTQTGSLKNVDFKSKNFPDKAALKKANNAIGKAEVLMDNGQFDEAMAELEIAYALNPDNATLNRNLGICCIKTGNIDKAVELLEKVPGYNTKLKNDFYFDLATAYHLSMQWEKAIDAYKDFRKKFTKKEKDQYAKLVSKKIKECDFGRDLSQTPVKVKIENMGPAINTEYPEYAPAISADESVLLFTSRRPGSTGSETAVNSFYYDDIYKIENKDGQWTSPVNQGPPVNTKIHDATIGISNDGQTLLIYKDVNEGDIYYCKLDGSKWQEPEAFPEPVNSDSHEPSASLSFNGRTLYFVSERIGGKGGKDIYVAKRDADGIWGKAENLGSTVNTKYDEDGVFIHPDGKTLYFSSQGHNTIGGYDIFRTVFNDDKWSDPENVGFPLNTADDDVFFVLAASGYRGYFSSRRPGGFGNTDLYSFEFLHELAPDSLTVRVDSAQAEPAVAPGADLTILTGFILDANDSPVRATIEVFDLNTRETIAIFESNSETGKYLVSLPSGNNYGMKVSAEDFLFYSENFDIKEGSGFKDVKLNIKMQKVEAGARIILKNVFFESGSAALTTSSELELESILKLMTDYPSAIIEVSGYTDNVGSETFNKKLSEKRAKAVVDFLTVKGIDTGRLEYVGFGLSNPIATNDTEEGRRQNRRTEFKIITK